MKTHPGRVSNIKPFLDLYNLSGKKYPAVILP